LSDTEPRPTASVPEGAAAAPPGAALPAPSEPEVDRNLWVPLVVVPALIVLVLVLVFTFFGAIAGREASPDENLDRMLRGGMNEQKQAAFALGQQVVEALRDLQDGRESDWELGEGVLARLRECVGGLSSAGERGLGAGELETEVYKAYVAAGVLAIAGDHAAIDALVSLARLPTSLDPDGSIRLYSIHALGSLGASLGNADQERVAAALAPFADDLGDEGLRLMTAAALQNLPTETGLAALRGLLADSALQVRGQAALSLAEAGDAAGASVLAELLDPASYVRDRARSPNAWSKGQLVHDTRMRALEALAELGRVEDRELLAELARGDSDSELRGRARELLEREPVGGAARH
jgi:hypothetical protein